MAWSSGNIEKERLERFCIAWEFSQVLCTNDRLLVLKNLTLGTKISNERRAACIRSCIAWELSQAEETTQASTGQMKGMEDEMQVIYMCVYIYIYICVCVYTRKCVCVCVCIYIC